MAELEGRRLTTFTVATDGRSFRLNFTEASGQASAVTLPTECLNQLLMTLPRLASQALRARYRDNSLRMVFPAEEWRLEAGTDDRVILTIGTSGGFEASFSFEPDHLRRIADSVAEEHIDAQSRRSLN